MATGYVTGLAALILAKSPYTSVANLKDRILRTVDTNANLQGKILTGGRINAYRALTESITGSYIYNISPDRGPVGSEVSIRGTDFKETAGHVIFEDNLEAPIISWTNEKIVCQVPEEAVTGSIHVETSGGSSNELHFEVTLYSTMGRIAFPYVNVESGRSSFIFFSNPLDHAITVEAFAVGSSGDNTLKFMTIDPFGKIVMDMKGFGILNEPFSLDCSSEELFGAAILTIKEDVGEVMFLPHLMLSGAY